MKHLLKDIVPQTKSPHLLDIKKVSFPQGLIGRRCALDLMLKGVKKSIKGVIVHHSPGRACPTITLSILLGKSNVFYKILINNPNLLSITIT